MKKRLLCSNLPKPGHPAVLSETEGHHAIRVLRLREGDLVEALDGKGAKSVARLKTKGISPQLEWVDDTAHNALIQGNIQSYPGSEILPGCIRNGSSKRTLHGMGHRKKR